MVVFEDLHWADEGLLDFVDHLVDWAGRGAAAHRRDQPTLNCSTRRPGWGGGKPNALTVSLGPALGTVEATRLVASPGGARAHLPDRGPRRGARASAGGNPLFAEEFARLIAEAESTAWIDLPESVHGIIAALDSTHSLAVRRTSSRTRP